jgi:hypothetical protein
MSFARTQISARLDVETSARDDSRRRFSEITFRAGSCVGRLFLKSLAALLKIDFFFGKAAKRFQALGFYFDRFRSSS